MTLPQRYPDQSGNTTKVAVSLLIPRTDKEEWNEKITKVNEKLSSLCTSSGIPSISHTNIDGKRHLNRSGVHPGGGYLGYEHTGRCRWKI